MRQDWYWIFQETVSNKLFITQTESQEMKWQMKSVNSYAIILYLKQWSYSIRSRQRPSANSRGMEKIIFPFGIPLIVTRTVFETL